MAASLTGNRSGIDTAKPARTSSCCARASRRRFWNTPPVRPTRRMPCSSRTRSTTARMAVARLAWNWPARIAGGMSPAISRGNSGDQSIRQSPSCRISGSSTVAAGRSQASASSRAAAWPSWLCVRHSPIRAAAPSNRRPAELLTGAFRPRRQADRASAAAVGAAGQSRSASRHSANAQRQGSRLALSPPIRRKGRRLATRCQAPGCPSSASPPQSVPSSP